MSLLDDNRDADAGDRDLALVAGLGGCAAVVMAVMAVLMSGATAATVLLGGPARFPAPARWGPLVGQVFAHPEDPGSGWPAPWSVTTGHAGLFWVLTGLIGLIALVVVGALAVWGWRRFGPTPPGHASRSEISDELSLGKAREIAERTRPSMTKTQRRHAPPEQLGAPCHRGPSGPLWVPFENPTGTLAPTQSGKSRRDLVHKALAAPGALLCSSTKPDLFEFVALARTRRPNAGPVALLDATGTVAWPAMLRWSPIQGCTTHRVAVDRAATMVEASAVGLRGVGGNDKVFRDRAATVIGAYLFAAALAGVGVDTLVNWGLNPLDTDTDPATGGEGPAAVLDRFQHHALAANLRREAQMVPETADAVWMSVRRVLEPLLDPDLRALCSPAPGTGFDAREFIAAQGSLFLIAGGKKAGPATPLLAALAEHWITTAQAMALESPTRRLDPPVTAVLDEVTNATPMPELASYVSDSAGRGVIIHWAAQSWAQLDDAFGHDLARALMDGTALMSIWGGLKDSRTLDWVSHVSGHHDRRRYQTHSDGMFSPSRTSIGTETVPAYRAGDVRKVPRDEVVIIFRSLGPIRARTTDVAQRRDWPQIRADVAAIRAATPTVDRFGYTTAPVLLSGRYPNPAGNASRPTPGTWQ